MNNKSLLKDPNFKRGFNIKGLVGVPNSNNIELVEKFSQDKQPVWELAQWAARYNLANPHEGKITEDPKGVHHLITKTNELICDTNNKHLIFTCYASRCYDVPRKKDEPWQHLLIETSFTNRDDLDPHTKVSNLKSLKINGKIKLLKFENHMGNQLDEEIHAAQFLLFLTIHNGNKNSKGFGEMIWFGMNLFDNRYEWTEYGSMFDIGTACLMVGIGNRPAYPGGKNFFENGKIIAGENTPQYTFSVEVIDKIKNAYHTARKDGYFENTQLDDLYVTGMNLGWEVPGTYDVSMSLRDFDIVVNC